MSQGLGRQPSGLSVSESVTWFSWPTGCLVNVVKRRQTLDSPGGEKHNDRQASTPSLTPWPLDLLIHLPAPEGESDEDQRGGGG